MRYISTRGAAPVLDFEGALLAGLARDGGLYLPETWPQFSSDEIRAMRGLSYQELAVRIMTPYVDGAMSEAELTDLVTDAYRDFDHAAIAPLKQLDGSLWFMELFHGPTLAFKDYPLQFLGRAFDHVLARRGRRVTIVGATSGDTGSAAIEACRDRDAIDIFMLYPNGRVSEVQRRQMTTVDAANVHALAIEGTFDDCQDLVKAMFNDTPFRDDMDLSAVNSINWSRIMAQIVYYFHAALSLGAPDVAVQFSVPSGNFGNVFAAYAARQMGLPVDQLIIGTNVNDILTRFFDSGVLETAPVKPTISPSMDIQISSNFERLLFDLYDRDGGLLNEAMEKFRTEGRLAVGDNRWQQVKSLFVARRIDDARTREEIDRVYKETGELIDPHSAIGVAAARDARRDVKLPTIALGAAHPAKFPDVVEDASGVFAPLPHRLADLYERQEHFTVLPNDLAQVQAFVRDHAKSGAAA
ncbi:MAG: threonine synthase [Alphaproteobacteria bacterium]|nr:threonine synthase [Alphaproteobacteria bacterium]